MTRPISSQVPHAAMQTPVIFARQKRSVVAKPRDDLNISCRLTMRFRSDSPTPTGEWRVNVTGETA